MKLLALLFCSLVSLCSCTDERRRSELDMREAEIKKKQSELLALQRNVFLKEQELIRREKALDSTVRAMHLYSGTDSIANDTTQSISYLGGLWSVTLVCTQSTCENFAVGDTKSEVWNVTTQQNKVFAQVVSARQLTRAYAGSVASNLIYLNDNNQSRDTTSASVNNIRLKMNTTNTLEGERELIRENCRVVYSVKMQKQQRP